METSPTKELTDEMQDNSLVIVSDKDGAKFLAKLRGCTMTEAGELFGAALASVHGQILMTLETFKKKYGDDAVEEFAAGIRQGRDKQVSRERLGVVEVPTSSGA